MTGRPTDYSAYLAEKICERITEGQSLRTICADEFMPGKATVFRWLAAFPEFRDQYARAREAQADVMAEEILEIADTPEEGERREEGSNKDGAFDKTVVEDMLGHRRLQVDARKWLMSKLAPKKYGDKVTAEHTGPGGGALVMTWLPPQS